MRLIDADALIARCKEIETIEWNSKAAPINWKDAYEDFEEEIDSAPTVGGWISVKDRMPEPYKFMLVYTERGLYGIDYMIENSESGKAVWALNPKVTHWMPLPEPPEEGSNDSQ